MAASNAGFVGGGGLADRIRMIFVFATLAKIIQKHDFCLLALKPLLSP